MTIDSIKTNFGTEAEQVKPLGVRETAKQYVEGKAKTPDDQRKILERAEAFVSGGVSELENKIAELFDSTFDQEIADFVEGDVTRLVEALWAEQETKLKNQPEKIARMRNYVAEMVKAAREVATQRLTSIGEADEAKKKELVQSAAQLVVHATRAITYQDLAASRLTIGDHGWMHLTQDFRDSKSLAAGFARESGMQLQSLDYFLLGLAAAYHDIGYASPQVHEVQRTGPSNYGIDVGHPLLSYVYLEGNQELRQQLIEVLDEETYHDFSQIVVNHENPERAAQAGDKELLSKAFAIADASAAYGMDKVPPDILRFPDIVTYLGVYSRLSNFDTQIYQYLKPGAESKAIMQTMVELAQLQKVIQNGESGIRDIDFQTPQIEQQLDQLARQYRDARDTERAAAQKEYESGVVGATRRQLETAILEANLEEEQQQAILDSLDHYGLKSAGLLVPRLSAESGVPRVEAGKVVLDVNAGFGKDMEQSGLVQNATSESAKLAVKLFRELSALQYMPGDQEKLIALLRDGASGDLDGLLSGLGIQVEADSSTKIISLISKTARLNYQWEYLPGQTVSSENKNFYDRVGAAFAQADAAVVGFIRQYNQRLGAG